MIKKSAILFLTVTMMMSLFSLSFLCKAAEGAADSSRDIPKENIVVKTGSYEPKNSKEGNPNYVMDGDEATIWHTLFQGTRRDFHYLTFTFNELTEVDSIRYLPRNGGNGTIKKFSLYYRNSETAEWISVMENKEAIDQFVWQQYSFDVIQAKQIKFKVEDAKSTNNKLFAAANEIRFTHPLPNEEVNKENLSIVINGCKDEIATKNDYTSASYARFVKAYNDAVSVKNSTTATQAQVNTGEDYLLYALSNLQLKDVTLDPTEIPVTDFEVIVSGSSEDSIVGEHSKLSTTPTQDDKNLYAKTSIFDNNYATFWTSNKVTSIAKGNPHLTVNLGKKYNLTKVLYGQRNVNNNNRETTGNIRTLVLEFSNDGTTWSNETTATVDASTDYVIVELNSPVVAQYVRISATSSTHWDEPQKNQLITVSELEFWGSEYIDAITEPYNIVHKNVNPDIINNVTLKYTDGHVMDGRTVGSYETLFDGKKLADSPYFDFGGNKKSGYIEVDLGSYYDVSSIKPIFYFKGGRRYENVLVLASENRSFTSEDIVYNNDTENKHKFGFGENVHTINETSDGRTITFEEKRRVRFIRIYMAGNTTGGGNQFLELEVYGVPTTIPDFITSEVQEEQNPSEWLYESTIDGVVRYVSPDVLQVKAQSEVNGDSANVRFISSVASENLAKIRFKIEVMNENGEVVKTGNTYSRTVYSEIKSRENNQVIVNDPKVVFKNDASQYFFVSKLNNIPRSAQKQMVRVTPYWLTLDAIDADENYVAGVPRIFEISEFFSENVKVINEGE